jgi:hypothetical protein
MAGLTDDQTNLVFLVMFVTLALPLLLTRMFRR